jgi:hypothetical protein
MDGRRSVMKLSGSDRRFVARKTHGLEAAWVYYEVKELQSDRFVRTFTVQIT